MAIRVYTVAGRSGVKHIHHKNIISTVETFLWPLSDKSAPYLIKAPSIAVPFIGWLRWNCLVFAKVL
ncbi:MAG: hypothetical protein AAFV90_25765 [Cyanobacteria bacterium J06634_5]